MNRWHKEAIKAIGTAKHPYGSMMDRLVKDWCRRQHQNGISDYEIKRFLKLLRKALKVWENEEIKISVMGRYNAILTCGRLDEVWFIRPDGDLKTFMGGG